MRRLQERAVQKIHIVQRIIFAKLGLKNNDYCSKTYGKNDFYDQQSTWERRTQ